MQARLQSFRDLGSHYWALCDIVPTWHFLDRCRERGFDRRWLPHLWNTGTWLPADRGRFELVGEVPGEGWWSVVIDLDGPDGVPRFITVTYEGEQRRVA